MRSNRPPGHCSGANICSKRTPAKSAHLRLASTRGAEAASIATSLSTGSKGSRQNTDRASHFERPLITGFWQRVQSECIFGSLIGTRSEIPGIGIIAVERVEILGFKRWARFAHASLSSPPPCGEQSDAARQRSRPYLRNEFASKSSLASSPQILNAPGLREHPCCRVSQRTIGARLAKISCKVARYPLDRVRTQEGLKPD